MACLLIHTVFLVMLTSDEEKKKNEIVPLTLPHPTGHFMSSFCCACWFICTRHMFEADSDGLLTIIALIMINGQIRGIHLF